MEDLSKQPNEHEIVDFVVGRFKKFAGLDSEEEKKKRKKNRHQHKNPLEADAEQYVEGEGFFMVFGYNQIFVVLHTDGPNEATESLSLLWPYSLVLT